MITGMGVAPALIAAVAPSALTLVEDILGVGAGAQKAQQQQALLLIEQQKIAQQAEFQRWALVGGVLAAVVLAVAVMRR